MTFGDPLLFWSNVEKPLIDCQRGIEVGIPTARGIRVSSNFLPDLVWRVGRIPAEYSRHGAGNERRREESSRTRTTV